METGSAQAWDDVVGDLYDAVLQKESGALTTAIQGFERAIDSDGCHLFGMSHQGQELFTVWTFPADLHAASNPYYEYYMHIDPRLEMVSRQIGTVVRTSDHFDTSKTSRSEFFQDYLRPLGVRDVAGGMLIQTGQISSAVAFNRLQGRPDFSNEELALAQRYFPHLKRAIGIALNDTVSTLLHDSQANLLQQQAVGVVGLNRRQQILFINAAAQDLLAPLPNLGLQGTALRDASPLTLACQQTHSTRQPQAMRLQTPKGELVVTAWVAPKRKDTTWLPSVSAASDQALHTCLLVQMLRPGHRLPPSLLMQLYGLTPAEARLAKELVQGSTVEAYAQTYHVSVATVRTQLRHVLAKSGYARQQDLIAHLATLQML